VSFRHRDHGRCTSSGRPGEWRHCLQELSGGQLALLNLSILLAIARHRPSLVLLMDEVDAALDEHNAARVAALLKNLSTESQVIAISHRPEFHCVADHLIRLHKDGQHTAVS
jgi:chromosome segregation protein